MKPTTPRHPLLSERPLRRRRTWRQWLHDVWRAICGTTFVTMEITLHREGIFPPDSDRDFVRVSLEAYQNGLFPVTCHGGVGCHKMVFNGSTRFPLVADVPSLFASTHNALTGKTLTHREVRERLDGVPLPVFHVGQLESWFGVDPDSDLARDVAELPEGECAYVAYVACEGATGQLLLVGYGQDYYYGYRSGFDPITVRDVRSLTSMVFDHDGKVVSDE